MREASRHPFIAFSFEPRTISHETWFLLGEAMSKCQHLAGSPLKPGAADTMASVFLARGVQATTAIEGNTLSIEEVQAIVDHGTAEVAESREYLQREVQNVLAAITDIDAALRSGEALSIHGDHLCRLNFRVLDGIPDEPEVVPGEFRQHNVAAGTYRAPDWHQVPELVHQFTKWLEAMRSEVNALTRPEDRFVNAVLSAILAHLYIAWIHPFGNGNGRVARLVEVQILSESGIVPLVATNLLSDYYNKTRTAYYRALDHAQRDVAAFVRYAVQGFVDELREQIEMVKSESMDIHWESYVYETFRSKPSTAARDRQRELALSMPAEGGTTPEGATNLTTSLARKYALCGDRTPARDMNDLYKMGLVRKIGHRRFATNRTIIRAFIPPVAVVE